MILIFFSCFPEREDNNYLKSLDITTKVDPKLMCLIILE
jgi:hypothetical protein